MSKRSIFLTLNVLVLAGLLSVPVNSDAQSGGAIFQVGPTMNRTRIDPFMATLDDGRIATFGGREFNFISGSHAELYNPATNTFSELTMNTPRDMAYVVKLQSGKYFIAGGSHDLGVAPGYATTEVFDPVANTFTATASMNYARCWATGALLSSGKVLIAGAWYNTSGSTYGELYDPVTDAFTLTGAMIQPRANALILPTDDGGAMVMGGFASYGGTNYTSVEYYSSSDNSFHSVSSEIIPGDAGWLVFMGNFHKRPAADYKMSSGKYLVGASRTREYGLLTFDPATKTFAKIATSSPLMDAWTDGGFFDIALDKASNTAYLLGVDSGSDPFQISLVAVNLTTGAVYHPASTFTMPSSEYLYPTMTFISSKGKLLLEGISSTTGDYFHATDKTYLITPQTPSAVESIAATVPAVNCYPNPTHSMLNFTMDRSVTDAVQINVYDISGRIYAQRSFDGSAPVYSLPVSHLPAGMYFYELRNNGNVIRDKFIKE